MRVNSSRVAASDGSPTKPNGANADSAKKKVWPIRASFTAAALPYLSPIRPESRLPSTTAANCAPMIMPLQRGMSASGTPIPSELEFERKKGRDGMAMAVPRMSAAVAAMAGPYGQERDNIVDIVGFRRAKDAHRGRL